MICAAVAESVSAVLRANARFRIAPRSKRACDPLLVPTRVSGAGSVVTTVLRSSSALPGRSPDRIDEGRRTFRARRPSFYNYGYVHNQFAIALNRPTTHRSAKRVIPRQRADGIALGSLARFLSAAAIYPLIARREIRLRTNRRLQKQTHEASPGRTPGGEHWSPYGLSVPFCNRPELGDAQEPALPLRFHIFQASQALSDFIRVNGMPAAARATCVRVEEKYLHRQE